MRNVMATSAVAKANIMAAGMKKGKRIARRLWMNKERHMQNRVKCIPGRH